MSKSCKRLPVKSLFTAALYFFLVASSFVFRCQFDNGRGRQSLVLVFRLENGVADLHVVTLVVERIRSHSFFVCLTSATFAVNAQKRVKPLRLPFCVRLIHEIRVAAERWRVLRVGKRVRHLLLTLLGARWGSCKPWGWTRGHPWRRRVLRLSLGRRRRRAQKRAQARRSLLVQS